MNNREAIANIEYARKWLGSESDFSEEALDMAISALEKQEQSCDTCKHKSEQFSGKRCGDCSVGYPDRYEAEKNFEPYTEDSAYAHGYTEAESKYREIRDELEKQAYQRGYKEAYDTAYADAEEIYESGKRAMYQKGLKDAWECARKICSEEDDGGIPASVINDIFNVRYYRYALRDFSASEAIEKIRQYEQEKDRQARIEYNFDEIKDVLSTTMKECNVSLDDIAEVLAKMKE